jgi:hypothetical protein
MRKILVLFIWLLSSYAHAQITAPNSSQASRPVANPDMLIQFNGKKIEVLPNSRAIKQGSSYSVITTDAADSLSPERLGVAYSYTSKGIVPLSGEISFKARPGFNVGSLGSMSSKLKILVPPDVYIFNVNSPAELVNSIKTLQTNVGIEWVEPFIAQVKVTP